MIEHAIDPLAERQVSNPSERFAINLSAQTLSDATVWSLIEHRLQITGIDPASLTFEVTETTAITNMHVAEGLLKKMRDVGCLTALDDFGSGLCSFAYLRDLPVDVVKIDGHFIKDLSTNELDASIVKAINEVVHASGMQTVAEFVEDQAGLVMLGSIGVDYAQGYHMGRPEILTACHPGETRKAA